MHMQLTLKNKVLVDQKNAYFYDEKMKGKLITAIFIGLKIRQSGHLQTISRHEEISKICNRYTFIIFNSFCMNYGTFDKWSS